MRSLVAAFRVAWRGARRHPAFAVGIILPLGIAAAGAVALFAVVNQLLLRPPPGVREPRRLFRVYLTGGQAGGPAANSRPFSLREYAFLRDGVAPKIDVIATARRVVDVEVRGTQAREPVDLVSSNYFQVLGVQPDVGGLFRPEPAGELNVRPVIVLSHQFWERALGGDASVIDRDIYLNGLAYRVIGVTRGAFVGLEPASAVGWIPAGRIADFGGAADIAGARALMWLSLFGRRPPGMSLAQVTAAIATVWQRDAVGARGLGSSTVASTEPVATALSDVRATGVVSPTTIALWLMGLSLLLLVTTCLNAGTLTVAQGYARREEVSVKLALGASHGALARELLGEAMIRSAAACTFAFLLVRGAVPALEHLTGSTIVATDWRMLMFAAVAVIAIAGLAALVPVLMLLAHLRAGGGVAPIRPQSVTLRSRPLRAVLVVQLALAFVLAAAATRLVAAVHRSSRLGLGLAAEQLAVVSLGGRRVRDDLRLAAERLRHVPGVTGTALSAVAPLYGTTTVPLLPPDESPSRGAPLGFGGNIVEPGYFRTVGMRLLAGRDFRLGDQAGAEQVAIVNQTMARMYWGRSDPIGRCLHGPHESSGGCWLRVVGVVNDSKLRTITEPPQPYVFTPLAQVPDNVPLVLNVRTGRPAAQAIPVIRDALAGMVPPAELHVRALSGLIAAQTAPWRRAGTAVSAFAVLAVAIAGFGIYAVTRLVVASRQRELAIRVALGSRPAGTIATLLRERLVDAVSGCAVGLCLFEAVIGRFAAAAHLPRGNAVAAAAFATALLGASALAGALAAVRRVARLQPAVLLRSA